MRASESAMHHAFTKNCTIVTSRAARARRAPRPAMTTMANSSYEELKDSAEIMSVPLAKTILVDLFKALNANREALEAAQAKVAALDKGEQMMGKMREVVPLVVQLLGKRLEYHPGQDKKRNSQLQSLISRPFSTRFG